MTLVHAETLETATHQIVHVLEDPFPSSLCKEIGATKMIGMRHNITSASNPRTKTIRPTPTRAPLQERNSQTACVHAVQVGSSSPLKNEPSMNGKRPMSRADTLQMPPYLDCCARMGHCHLKSAPANYINELVMANIKPSMLAAAARKLPERVSSLTAEQPTKVNWPLQVV